MDGSDQPLVVTVCIPTIRPDTVGDAIASIRGQSYPHWNLVVVGQGREELIRPAVEAARGDDGRVSYVHLDRMGLSIARNRVLDGPIGDIVAFTDDDCEAPVDWLSELVRACHRHPDAGLIFGSLIAPTPEQGTSRFRVCPDHHAAELFYDPIASGRQAPPGWGAVGANIAVRRDVAARLGGFDENLGAGSHFAAAEETDYMLRAELLGVCMYSTPEVVVNHTFGYRYGWKAVYRHRRGYARGNGALAAKQALLGDPRGTAWMRREIRAATVEPIRTLKPQRLPSGLLRLAYFVAAYYRCRRDYVARSETAPGDVVSATLHSTRGPHRA
jgi:GT2 family glycosyltransferase